MAFALIAHVTGHSLNPFNTNASFQNTTGADLIVVQVTWSWNGGNPLVGPEPILGDNAGNTYTPLTNYNGNGVGASSNIASRLYYCSNPTTSTTHAWQLTSPTTPGVSSIALALCAAAFSGSIASPFDQEDGQGGNANVTTLACSPGGGLTVTDGYLVVAGLAEFATGAVSINNSLSITDAVVTDASTYYTTGLAWIQKSGTGNINPTWSWSANAANQQTAAMAVFKAAAATNVNLTGIHGTGSVGTLTPSLGTVVNLTGLQGTSGLGSFTVTGTSTSVNLTGIHGTGSVGSFSVDTGGIQILWDDSTDIQWDDNTQILWDSGDLNINLTGIQGTGSVGTLTPDLGVQVHITGIQGTGSVGTFGFTISSNITLRGVRGIGRVGHFVGINPKGGGVNNTGGMIVNIGTLMNR